MDVIISLDTEDWVTPEAADAQLWWPTALAERNMRGSFQCVGQLLRHLRSGGRHDVIDALRGHEVGYHSDLHSVPPTHPESVQRLGFAEGVRWVRNHEAEGLTTFREVFSCDPISYTTPGDSWTASTLVAMAAEGAKVCPNGMLRWWTGETYWYGGLLNTHHGIFLDEFLATEHGDRAMLDLFEARARALPDAGVIVIATHPTRLVTADYWDRPFYHGARTPIEEIPPAPLRPKSEITAVKDRVLGWLDCLVARPDVRLTDFKTLYQERTQGRKSLADLITSPEASIENLADLSERNDVDSYFSEADVMRCNWNWLPLPPNLDEAELRRQALRLLWTSAPARR